MFSSPFRKTPSRSVNEPQLIPWDGSGEPDPTGCQADAAADCSDRTYEDALLDSQVRRFIRADMQSAIPPPDSFNRIQHAIAEEREEPVRRRATRTVKPSFSLRAGTVSMSQSLRRLAHNGNLSRALSGAVAVVFMLAALSSNASMLLRNGDDELAASSYLSGVAEDPRQEFQREILDLRKANPQATSKAENVADPSRDDPYWTWAPPKRDVPWQDVTGSSDDVLAPTMIEMRKE